MESPRLNCLTMGHLIIENPIYRVDKAERGNLCMQSLIKHFN